jgi:hypothetical protein
MIYPADKVVYLHRRATDGVVFYVGMGSQKRARSGTGRSAQWRAVASVAGFICEIVRAGMTITEALAAEMQEIAKYPARELTNLNPGGGGCKRHTEATRRKQSENCSSKRPEVRAKIAATMRGRKRPGLKISPVALDALRRAQEARTGTKHTPETIARMKEAQRGRRKTEAHKQRVKETKRDKTEYRFWHPERGAVVCDKDSARTVIGASVSAMTRLLNGRRETCYGWKCLGPAQN